MNYYNEWDETAAAWLRNLIAAKLIPAGDVDQRDIRLVQGADLKGYTQCHFFAGIGGWSLALKLAGWPEDRPVWTGSCPCQPFSAAGKRKGKADDRHLWPDFLRLIAECNPPVVFGEQVASKDGRLWLSGVRADLEALAYRGGGSDLCAAGIGAPHIRQRLYWVADAKSERRNGSEDPTRPGRWRGPEDGSWLGDSFQSRLEGHAGNGDNRDESGRIGTEAGRSVTEAGAACGMADSNGRGCGPGGELGGLPEIRPGRANERVPTEGAGTLGRYGFWSSFDLIPCADGKARRVEPGTFPLAHGVPGRVGKLRAYGNAIVPQVAAEFVKAYMEVTV